MKKKTIISIILSVLLLSGCRKQMQVITVGSLWHVEFDSGGEITSWVDTEPQVADQRQGYEEALKSFTDVILVDKPFAEQKEIYDLLGTVDTMVDDENVVMIVGATTHDATMHSAATSDFYNVPFLIPFADGNYLISDKSTDTIRITPAGEDYANFIVSNMLSESTKELINNLLFEDSVVPDYNIHVGIVFENSTYGHSMAVALADALMKEKVNIDVYQSFDTDKPVSNRQKAEQIDRKYWDNLDITFFVMENNNNISAVSDLINSYDEDSAPLRVMLGYTISDDLISRQSLADFLFIRTALDHKNCPANIHTYAQSLGYASGYITGCVIKEAMAKMPAKKSGLSMFFKSDAQKEQYEIEYNRQLRSTITENLRKLDADIPCFGHVSFSPSGELNNPGFEIVSVVDGKTCNVSVSEFVNSLANRISQRIEGSND